MEWPFQWSDANRTENETSSNWENIKSNKNSFSGWNKYDDKWMKIWQTFVCIIKNELVYLQSLTLFFEQTLYQETISVFSSEASILSRRI